MKSTLARFCATGLIIVLGVNGCSNGTKPTPVNIIDEHDLRSIVENFHHFQLESVSFKLSGGSGAADYFGVLEATRASDLRIPVDELRSELCDWIIRESNCESTFINKYETWDSITFRKGKKATELSFFCTPNEHSKVIICFRIVSRWQPEPFEP